MPVNIELFNEYLYALVPEDKSLMYLGIREYLSRGGKRFRPMLTFLTYGSFTGYYHDILYHGAIIELFHSFTLIHDDIEDGSELRRGKPTLHVQYGIPLALNTGDALYTLVLSLINRLDDKRLRIDYIDTFTQVVEGQAMDIYWREKGEFPNEDQYYQMIARKTGALIGLSMHIGAYLAGKDDPSYFRLGRLIGMAFQIQDDLLNLKATEEYGKKWADDITEGKRTLMVVHALSNLDEKHRNELINILNSHSSNDDDKRRAIELIEQGGGIEYTENRLEEYFNQIDREMQRLFSKSNEYGEELFNFIDKMKRRKA